MEPREYSSEASACVSSWLWTPTPLKTKKHFLFKKQTWYMYMWQCWEHRFCTGNLYVKEIPMFLVWVAAWSWLRLHHCCYLLLSEDMAESETIWKSLSVTCPDPEHFSASSPAQRCNVTNCFVSWRLYPDRLHPRTMRQNHLKPCVTGPENFITVTEIETKTPALR